MACEGRVGGGGYQYGDSIWKYINRSKEEHTDSIMDKPAKIENKNPQQPEKAKADELSRTYSYFNGISIFTAGKGSKVNYFQ